MKRKGYIMSLSVLVQVAGWLVIQLTKQKMQFGRLTKVSMVLLHEREITT